VWSEFPQAVQSALFRQYHQAVKTGRVVHFETFYPPLDTWFEIHAYPSADGLSVYFSNINERVRAAEERTKLIDTLELERTRFAAIIEQLPLGVICAEAPSGRIIMGNKQVEAILRHPLLQSDSIADYEVWRGWHLDGRPVQPEEWPLARAVRGEATIQEFRYQRGDGSLCVLRARGTPVTDSTGNTVAGVITFDDITEQKRDEETRNMLLMREQRRTQQLQGLTTASLVINSAQSLDEVLQVITEQARHIIGAHQAVTSQTVDQNWAQAINVVSLSDKYATYRTYNATTYGAGIYTVVCQTNHSMRLTQAELEAHPAWRKFGSEAASHPPMRGWLAAPLVSRDGHNLGLIQLSDKYEGEFTEEDEALLVQLAQIASIAIDNTRLIEAERQSRKASQEAVQVRDAFLSIAAHELKTPLTSLYGNAQLLQRRAQRDGSTSERDTRAINVIVEQANRLNRMIVALLDVTRLEKGQLSIERAQIDLAALVAKTIDEMRLTLTRHTIAYALPPEPIYIEGDDLRLQQVFQNLISNAIKYSPLGGTVTVRAERRDNQACVAVIDQGIGIPAEALPQLFHRFYRAENVDQQHISGIGIGLFVVKEIVTLHGGTVEVTSAEGTGSTFTVSFPLTSRG
jgi:PAS domain S-box-containing protein